MNLLSCRVRSRAALLLLATSLSAATSASAQDDAVISDPELEGGSTPAEAEEASEGDQVFSDPELESAPGGAEDHGWGEAATQGESPAPSESADEEYDPQANTGLAHIELDGRVAADLHHEGYLEDVYESRLRLDTEVEFRRSRRLRLSVGVRLDLLWALPSGSDPFLDYDPTPEEPKNGDIEHFGVFEEDRFELDILPLSAYIDATPADGFHVRIGTQSVSMARSDFFSAVDMLAVYDGRGQPRLDPGTPKIAQPALRIDWDLSSWATLQAIYVPWFMPHLQRPTRDNYASELLGLAPSSASPVDRLFDPSWQTKASESGARFVGPTPDFTTPQAQARLNFRGSSYELGLSGGTALEKAASIYLTPALEAALRDPLNRNPFLDLSPEELASGPLLDVEYHRYHQVGLDGSFDIAPVTVAFELSYSPARYLFPAATRDGSRLPQPNVSEEIKDPDDVFDDDGELVRVIPSNVDDRSIRKGVPTVQGALHFDWIDGERLMVAAELFWIQTLQLPYDESRDWLFFRPNSGSFVAGLVGATYRLNEGQWSFETALTMLRGPSIISASQIEFRAREGFYVNVGALIYEGSAPRKGYEGSQQLQVGGLLSNQDQVFIGFRYLP